MTKAEVTRAMRQAHLDESAAEAALSRSTAGDPVDVEAEIARRNRARAEYSRLAGVLEKLEMREHQPRRTTLNERNHGDWRRIGIDVGEELAAQIDLGYLGTSGSGHTVWPVIHRDALDPYSAILDLDEKTGTGPAWMDGGEDETREYALARGYAALFALEREHRAGHADDAAREIVRRTAEAAGARAPGEARIHIPERMRGIVVSSVVFGRPVEVLVMAGSNVGALMMAAHRAATELTTHPQCRTRVGGRPADPLPLHPDVIDGRRLCFDPARNAPGEPWTWGPGAIHDADVEATSFVWHEDPDAEMRGWYIVTRDGRGEPVEITGPVRHDARAVIIALVDTFPEPRGGDTATSARRLADMAIRRLSESIEQQRSDGDGEPSATLERRTELRNHLERETAERQEHPAGPGR